MPGRFKVELILSDAHWQRYTALLINRRTTIDIAHAWLTARGYSISRNAVWQHRRAFFAMAFSGRDQSNIGNKSDARRLLAASVAKLDGQRLSAVAQFAAFVANSATGSGERFGRRSNAR